MFKIINNKKLKELELNIKNLTVENKEIKENISNIKEKKALIEQILFHSFDSIKEINTINIENLKIFASIIKDTQNIKDVNKLQEVLDIIKNKKLNFEKNIDKELAELEKIIKG